MACQAALHPTLVLRGNRSSGRAGDWWSRPGIASLDQRMFILCLSSRLCVFDGCKSYMAGGLNDSQLAAVNDVIGLLPHARLQRGT